MMQDQWQKLFVALELSFDAFLNFLIKKRTMVSNFNNIRDKMNNDIRNRTIKSMQRLEGQLETRLKDCQILVHKLQQVENLLSGNKVNINTNVATNNDTNSNNITNGSGSNNIKQCKGNVAKNENKSISNNNSNSRRKNNVKNESRKAIAEIKQMVAEEQQLGKNVDGVDKNSNVVHSKSVTKGSTNINVSSNVNGNGQNDTSVHGEGIDHSTSVDSHSTTNDDLLTNLNIYGKYKVLLRVFVCLFVFGVQ